MRRQDNRERYRATDRRRQATPHRQNAQRRYREAHKDYFAAKQREFRLRHPEEVKARWAAWYAANPEKVRLKGQMRDQRSRAAKAGVESTLTRDEWQAIKALYKNRCAYCGQEFERLSQDHVIPISKGGKHVASNIVPACRSCNSRKSNRLVDHPKPAH